MIHQILKKKRNLWGVSVLKCWNKTGTKSNRSKPLSILKRHLFYFFLWFIWPIFSERIELFLKTYMRLKQLTQRWPVSFFGLFPRSFCIDQQLKWFEESILFMDLFLISWNYLVYLICELAHISSTWWVVIEFPIFW